ncbi:hypothetical protein ACOMHN_049825 [Nucella lapillus]
MILKAEEERINVVLYFIKGWPRSGHSLADTADVATVPSLVEDDAEAAGRAPHITKPRRQPTGSSDQKAPEAADGLLGLFPLMRPALRDWRILLTP